MAISQDRYIQITSSIFQPTVRDRDLSGLVFSNGAMLESVATTDANYVKYTGGKPITLSLSEVATYFGTTSDEYKFAQRYFSYISPSGRSPQALSFVDVGASTDSAGYKGNLVDAFEGAISETTNFGSFTFLPTTGGIDISSDFSAMKDVYTLNDGLNYMFLAIHGEIYNSTTSITRAQACGALKMTNFTVGADKYCAALPMAIAAATRYDRNSSATCFMYKQLAAENPVVNTDTLATTLDDAHINYYGQTQVNGQQIAFYQRGVNLDGTDTAIAYNEMWLKSQVATNFFNYVTNVERIPANYVGESIVESAIVMPVILQGLSNEVIMPGKTLTAQQRAAIFQYTGDETAADQVQENGYWLSTSVGLRSGSDSEYEASYRLVYSKADSIRFVDGTHNLI